MYSFSERLGSALRALWLQVGACLFVLILLDVLLRLGHWVYHGQNFDSRVLADGFKNAPWAEQVMASAVNTKLDWFPYVYWKSRPYKSRYFNIGNNGLRVTVGAKHSPGVQEHPIRIFTFGGSTMWGEGSRDPYTIPSWLQTMLGDSPYSVEVVNYGQDGYVNTQEMLLLFEQLRKGNVPDIALFYDGFNDSASAIINDSAGVTYGEMNRKAEFNVFNPWATDNTVLYKQAALAFAMNSGMGRLAKKVLATLDPGRFQQKEEQLIVPGDQIANREVVTLQDQVVKTYLANKRLTEAAARSFGFKCLFFWQPTVWTKAKLTPYEAQQKWLMGEKEFLTGVYERIATISNADDIHDLSGVFGTSGKPYFIDDAHITEAGNRIVAQAMLPEVLRTLKEIRAQKAGVPPAAQGAIADQRERPRGHEKTRTVKVSSIGAHS